MKTSIFILTIAIIFGFTYQHQTRKSDKDEEKTEIRLLKKDSLIHDLNLLEQALTELHAGIYRYNTKEDIENEFDMLRANVKDQMSEADFMKLLAQSVVKIRCGHTYLNPWNMKADIRNRLFGGKKYFPLGFKILNKKFYVTHNASENKDIQRGAEIKAVNGISTTVIYDSLMSIVKSDGHNFAPAAHYLSLQNYNTRYWQAFDIYYPLFFPSQKEEFEVEYQNYEEKSSQKTSLAALGKKERTEKMTQKYGEEVLDNEKWKLDIINPKLAVMRLGTFSTWKWKNFDSKKWFEEAFTKLEKESIDNLIIDIRGNGGGLSEPRDELMNYLAKEKIACKDLGQVLIRTTKLNPELLPYIETWEKSLIKGLIESQYSKGDKDWYVLKEKSDCVDINPKKGNYKGKTYIFGGASNVSATYTLLDKSNQYNLATYVGEGSGGNRQGINGGVYAFFYMPYSGMEVDIPLKHFAPTSPQKDEGVYPKVEIEYTQKDIAENRDPYLAYVLNEIDN